MSNDIDTIALDVARRFTLDTEPQRRASLQVAIIEAIKRAFSLSQPVSGGALPDWLLVLIGEYGFASSAMTDVDRIHHWQELIAGIKRYAAPSPPADAAALPAAKQDADALPDWVWELVRNATALCDSLDSGEDQRRHYLRTRDSLLSAGLAAQAGEKS